MIKILLVFLIALFAPIPWVTILGHKLAMEKKISLKFFISVLVPLWIILAYLFYMDMNEIFSLRILYFPLQIFGIIILFFALLIEVKTRKILGNKRILGISELNKSKDKLITNGIYKYARHPRYVEHSLWFLGLGFLFGYVFLLIFSAYLFVSFAIASVFEEKELIQRYGKDYIKYKKKTPAFFVKFN